MSVFNRDLSVGARLIMLLPTFYSIATFVVDVAMLRFLKKTIIPEKKRQPINSVSGDLKTGEPRSGPPLTLNKLLEKRVRVKPSFLDTRTPF